MTSIAVIDDHEIVRIGIRTILKQNSDFSVVLEYERAEEVRENLEQISRLADIILLDLELPDATDLELLEFLNENLESPRIIILTSHSEEDFAIKAIQKGASGFLSKAFDMQSIQKALVSVMNGGLFLSPHATELLRFGEQEEQTNIYEIYPDFGELSEKERQVFHHICEGLSIKEIAFEMDCSMKSVSTYKSRLMEKLGAGSLVDIIVLGVKNGFIQKSKQA